MKILRKLNRFYTNDLKMAVNFYESLLGQKSFFQHLFPELDIEIAQIDDILIVASSSKNFLSAQNVKAVFVVDEINDFKEYLSSQGVEIIKDVKESSLGWNMLVKHPEGTLIEYAQFKEKLCLNIVKDRFCNERK